MSAGDAVPDGGLTTAEVAELLGVKRQTVYAYVSRGILHRQMALDGRTSIFDRAEVEELRLGRRPDQEGIMRTMLATRLTRVSDDGLWIRGRDLISMVNGGATFHDVADLLWDSPAEEVWPVAPGQRPVHWPGLEEMPLLDQLRVFVSIESSDDPLRHDLSPKSVRAAGRRAIIAMSSGLNGGRIAGFDPAIADAANGNTPETDSPDSGHLAKTLWMALSGQAPSIGRCRALDVALALLADHGMAGSTFAARIAASVRADPYSVIGAGLGVIGGTLHGAASAQVHELYTEADRSGDPAAVVGTIQSRGERVPGFGHMVYRSQDGRYGALMGQIVEAWSDDPRLQTVFRVRDVVGERSDAIPNIDLALGALTFLADMPSHGGEAVFAISRTAGWLAHAMEEYEEKPVRFRPKARYIGPSAGL